MCANEIEGAEKLAREKVGFSSENVEATAAPENGKWRFKVSWFADCVVKKVISRSYLACRNGVGFGIITAL